MRILALTDSKAPWHSFWIRFGQYLEDLPWPIDITDDAQQIDHLKYGDQLFFYRFSPNWKELDIKLYSARKRGVLIISDIDDYLWQAKGWNRDRLIGITRALRQCNVITCSTNPLKEQLEVMFPSIPILVIYNTSPITSENQYSKILTPPIRIGWTGAPWTRLEDLKILIPLTNWLITNHKFEIKFVHIGHFEGHVSFAEALSIPKNMVETHPIQDHKSYLKNLDFHIGLAPLANQIFNKFKSAVKLLEYSSLGIPWIASDMNPYKEMCNAWNWKGRLCYTSEDWITHVKPLLNHKIRQEEGKALKQLCFKHSSYNSGVKQWEKLLSRKDCN